MKKLLLVVFAAAEFSFNSNSQIFDDFNEGVINPALWTTSLPSGNSQIFESGGRAVMIARGGLGSVQSFSSNLEVTGRFKFTGQEDHFGITIRSDLVFANSFMEKYGLRISFQDNSQSLRITEYNTRSPDLLEVV